MRAPGAGPDNLQHAAAMNFEVLPSRQTRDPAKLVCLFIHSASKCPYQPNALCFNGGVVLLPSVRPYELQLLVPSSLTIKVCDMEVQTPKPPA